jgi:hypothetical protein
MTVLERCNENDALNKHVTLRMPTPRQIVKPVLYAAFSDLLNSLLQPTDIGLHKFENDIALVGAHRWLTILLKPAYNARLPILISYSEPFSQFERITNQ